MRLRYALLVTVIAGLLVGVSQRAQAGDKPLSKLAGSFMETAQGTFALCFDLTSGPTEVPCNTTGAVALPFTFLGLGQITRDANGNACNSLTQGISDLPVDASPPQVAATFIVGTVTNYDSQTAIGDGTFAFYSGSGKCVGATFQNNGATAGPSGTYHFIASQGGNRVDFLITQSTDPAGGTGDFSLSGYDLRQ